MFDWQRQVRSGLNPKSADKRTMEWENRDSTAVLKGAKPGGYACLGQFCAEVITLVPLPIRKMFLEIYEEHIKQILSGNTTHYIFR